MRADKVTIDIDTNTAWAVSYITFTNITFISVNDSCSSTPSTTFREQAGLGAECQSSG